LAGLGMKIGTDVSDDRVHRRIGYWTGTGLSENVPEKPAKTNELQAAPDLGELLAVLENEPASHYALETAAWILLNTPDGDAVEKAGEVILREHLQSPDLGYLAQEMARVRHRCVPKLLAGMLESNPNPEVQAIACFTLATLQKDAAKYGENKSAVAQA